MVCRLHRLVRIAVLCGTYKTYRLYSYLCNAQPHLPRDFSLLQTLLGNTHQSVPPAPTPALHKTTDLGERPPAQISSPKVVDVPKIASKRASGGCDSVTTLARLDEMSRVVHNSGITYGNNNRNCGNSNNIEFNQCNISIPDEKRQILEWISPFASRERHQAVRDSRVEKVGDWLLCKQSFSAWRTLEDRTARPVLFCYGHPGAGKTYIRYEPL